MAGSMFGDDFQPTAWALRPAPQNACEFRPKPQVVMMLCVCVVMVPIDGL